MIFAIPRTLGPVPLDVVVREVHFSDLEITENPVEFGAAVSDHAYVKPKKLRMDAVTASRAGGEAAINAAYQSLLQLQDSREPFDVVTGLHIYRNMLVKGLRVNRTTAHAKVLYFTAELQEVIIVDTETAAGEASGQNRAGKKQSNMKRQSLQSGNAQDRGSPTRQSGNTSTAPASGSTQVGSGSMQVGSGTHRSTLRSAVDSALGR